MVQMSLSAPIGVGCNSATMLSKKFISTPTGNDLFSDLDILQQSLVSSVARVNAADPG